MRKRIFRPWSAPKSQNSLGTWSRLGTLRECTGAGALVLLGANGRPLILRRWAVEIARRLLSAARLNPPDRDPPGEERRRALRPVLGRGDLRQPGLGPACGGPADPGGEVTDLL